MKILFLGDIVGPSGCEAVNSYLPSIIKEKKIDFVIANGENAAKEGVGITKKIATELFQSGINVITTGNHVWDQKEIISFISNEKKLLRPEKNQRNGKSGIISYKIWYRCILLLSLLF